MDLPAPDLSLLRGKSHFQNGCAALDNVGRDAEHYSTPFDGNAIIQKRRGPWETLVIAPEFLGLSARDIFCNN